MTGSVIFICNMNSVRSPMAAALMRANSAPSFHVDSAGVYEGGLDPFVEIVMQEIDLPIDGHEPKSLNDVDLGRFDTIVALTPEAAVEARRALGNQSIEFWDIENPSDERGGREAIIEAYRRVRDDLKNRLRSRFPEQYNTP